MHTESGKQTFSQQNTHSSFRETKPKSAV